MLYEVITRIDPARVEAQRGLEPGDVAGDDRQAVAAAIHPRQHPSSHAYHPDGEPRALPAPPSIWSAEMSPIMMSPSVITSYSIHYTKLYDRSNRAVRTVKELDTLDPVLRSQ